MIKRALLGLALLGLLLAAGGSAATAQEPVRLHTVVEVEGELRVQRSGRTEWVTAYAGDPLGEPRVYQLLGDLYVRVALNRPAEERYLEALALAEARADLEGEGAAHDGLGKVYLALGNVAEAAAHSTRALELYRGLGDAHKVAEIEARLAGLPPS